MEIEGQIIHIDGSCRDINFPDVDRTQAILLLEYLQGFCSLKNATTSEGNNLSVEKMIEHLSSSVAETIVSDWECQGLISQIQLFFSWKNRSKVFIELTFFPQDVDKQDYSLKSFMRWLRPILVALNTRTYYVRYENASWAYGDTSESSGVIFSNSQTRIALP